MKIVSIYDHKEGTATLVKSLNKAAKILGIARVTLVRWYASSPYKHYKNYTVIIHDELILSGQGKHNGFK